MKLKDTYIRLTDDQRLYKLPVPVIGLTGGIASGKSTVAKMLNAHGIPLINADHLVKEVYSMPKTFSYIEQNHPDVIQNKAILFPKLREKVFMNPQVKEEIEKLIYQSLPQAFMDAFNKLKSPELVLYDVPLLFEKKMEGLVDLSLLVYAPRKVQRARLIIRDGHQEPLADKILDQQMDIEDKKLKADFIIDNSQTEAELTEEVKHFLRQVMI